MTKELKLKAVEQVLKKMDKELGAGTVMWANASPNQEIATIPTGIVSLDLAIGGGIPKGRITEIFGAESSGKTSLALTLAAQVQKADELVVYIDMEHALNFDYMRALGVDIDSLLLSQPDSAEDALDILQAFVESGAVGLIVVDSVAALVPQKEKEGETADSTVGLVARFMHKSIRKIIPLLGKSQTACVFINQVRDVIGSYVPTVTTPGGRALKFASSLRLEIRRGKENKNGDEVVGLDIKIAVKKNKIVAPSKVVEVPFVYGSGFDTESDMVDLAIKTGLVEKSGAWIRYDGEQLQGIGKFKEYLQLNPDKKDELIAKVKGSVGE